MTKIKRRYDKPFSVKKEYLEWFLVSVLLILSFFSTITLVLLFVYLITFIKQREVGAIKIINILTLRSVINPGLAVSIGQLQNLKWVLVLGCAMYLLISYRKMNKDQREKINKVSFFIIIFAVYSIISSLVFSSLPIVAVFKILSYTITFLGIVFGVVYTANKINWLNWLIKLLSLAILPSVLLIELSVGYLRNGLSFQGFINHPNLFGVVVSLFIALLFTYKQKTRVSFRMNFFLIIIISYAIYLIVLSGSRTALISFFAMLSLFIIFSNIKIHFKYIIFLFTFSIAAFLPKVRESLLSFMNDFLYKGNEDLLYSRSGQVEGLMNNFLSNPIFGTGFQVPVLFNKSYEFSFDYIVEPGNLFLAVLSYGGIIGLTLFSIYIFQIFIVGIKNFKNSGFLFVIPIMISMGEMVFFSTNNIGIWCYMCFAIYLTSTIERESFK